MNEKEWKQVEESLKSFFTLVELEIDGYRVSLRLVRVGTYKAEIAIYINGVFEGKWLIEDCEIRRRFLQKSKRRLFSDKEIKKMGVRGKNAEKMKREKYCVYYNTWSSFRSLKNHLIAHNNEIKLINGGKIY